MNFADAALRIAAKIAGLRPDQVASAVDRYREVTEKLHDEPEWRLARTMSGSDFGLMQYVADDTRVALQIDSTKCRGEWVQKRSFTLEGEPFESFGEARAIELERTASAHPYAVRTHYAHSGSNEA